METVLRLIDNRMNPLLLREIRQLVRNRFIIVLINLFIAILVLICLMTALTQEATRTGGAGYALFWWLVFVMGTACFLAVVVYTSMTTSSERINGDLMFTTAMKPSAIVLGKAFSGAILTILLMSITTPFVTLAYLLRGLDIEWVAATFLTAFLTIQMLNAVAICVFSNVKTKVQLSSIMAVGFFALIFGVPWAIQHLFAVFGGSTSIISWAGLSWLFLSEIAIMALFLAGAVVSIAPPTSNRLLPIRLTLTTIYLGSLFLCLMFPSTVLAANSLDPWVNGWSGALVLLILLIVCERDTWSFRIKQTIPRTRLFRAFLFPFYTGAPNGLAWFVLLLLGILGISNYVGASFDERMLFWLLFALDYCLSALLIRSWLMPRSVTPDKTWAIVLFQVLCGTLGSLLAFLVTSTDSLLHGDFFLQYRSHWLSILNPFLLEESFPPVGDLRAIGAVYWGLALVVPVLFWFLVKSWHFSPFDRSETISFEQAVAAVRDADDHPLVQSDRERARKARSAVMEP